MKSTLTPKQRARIIDLAKDNYVRRLYVCESLNGYSMTLRSEHYTDTRSSCISSGMVFSVDLLEFSNPTPAEKAKTAERHKYFRAKVAEAQELFSSVRNGALVTA
jgi:hypothetical protein